MISSRSLGAFAKLKCLACFRGTVCKASYREHFIYMKCNTSPVLSCSEHTAHATLLKAYATAMAVKNLTSETPFLKLRFGNPLGNLKLFWNSDRRLNTIPFTPGDHEFHNVIQLAPRHRPMAGCGTPAAPPWLGGLGRQFFAASLPCCGRTPMDYLLG